MATARRHRNLYLGWLLAPVFVLLTALTPSADAFSYDAAATNVLDGVSVEPLGTGLTLTAAPVHPGRSQLNHATNGTHLRFLPDLYAPNSSILPKPSVSDPKLQNYGDDLYKGTTNANRVGTGTTADAVRNEVATGLPTGGTFHATKAHETARGLERWLRNNPGASQSDRLVAQSLLDDLNDALEATP